MRKLITIISEAAIATCVFTAFATTFDAPIGSFEASEENIFIFDTSD